ncbi:GAF domain-containing protein [Halobacterium jilantaiense]|uniref:histidine kinase n=1 Tax=Halobacterium jilantaiense TaxID=355548 RepID=A0A1I0N264_9EURY|nr:GAF domain-containing protein [Halobacterium jilantaiense]SEV94448.1 PAS/PAC sensor signal transduction histidine kinase [Halobacterium jilantaiense]
MTADSTGGRGDLLEYATAVATAEDTDTVFEELASAAERAFGFSSTVVEAKDSGLLSVRSWSGEPPDSSGIGADEGLAGHAFQTGETVHVSDMRADPRVEDVPSDAPRSVVSVPMGNAGVFQASRDEPGGFDDEDIAVVEQLAEHARRAVERIRSKQRLKASERRFRSLFEDADHPVVLYSTTWGQPGTIEYANEAAEELFDASEADLREHELGSLLAADASELVPEDGAHTVETELDEPVSMRVLDVTVKPMPDAGDADAFAELRDVTEQTQRERVLTSLHDATRRMFVSEDRSEIASVMVEAAEGLVDLPYVGVFFEADGDLHPESVSSPVSTNGPPVLRAGESIAWEVYDSGEPEWVRDVADHPKRHNADSVIEEEFLFPLGDHGVLLVGAEERGVLTREDRDLAGILAANGEAALDRAEHEQRLREQETTLRDERNRLAALFENVPSPTAGFTVEDNEPILQSVNSAFETVFGYDESELVGENIDDYIVPPSRRGEAELYNRKLQAGKNINVEVRRETADGPRDFLLDVVPFKLEEPTVQGYAMYTEITDRKERERELERQNDRLEEFASIVSHDLRNPLNVARGYVELAEETKSDEHFERVDEALERMADIVDDVLTLARQGRSLEETEAVPLAAAAESAWRNVNTEGASLELEDPPTLSADPTRIGSLLENLFGNAVEHGTECVTGERADGGGPLTVTVGGLGGEDDAGFYVEDDGVGIPEERRDVVFESGETFSVDGTGFGLAIVEDIAEAHGLDVTLTESESGGARFEFTPEDSTVVTD